MEQNDSLGEIKGLVKIDTTVAPFIGNPNVLDVIGTGGIILPKGTTEQRPTNTAGVIRYNTSTNAIELGNGSTWGSIASDFYIFKTIAVSGQTSIVASSAADTLTITGSGITITTNASTNTLTLSHTDTSSQSSVDNSSGNVIQDITLDTYGHITALGSVDLDSRYYTETEIDTLLSGKQNADADLSTWAGITPASGIGTFLTTPTSSNLAAAVTDETGTGALVFATSPTLSSPNISGNLTFTGTGNRIIGDFSNATQSSRVSFQTSTTNGNTIIQAIPNGTAVATGFNVHNSSDIGNASIAQLSINSTIVALTSFTTGTGSYLPLTFHTGGSERMRLDTNGNLGINITPAFKLHAYATGGSSVSAAFKTDQSGSYITFRDATTASDVSCRIGVIAEDLVVLTNGAVEKFRVTSTGNIYGGGTNAGSTKYFRYYNGSGTTNSAAVLSLDPGNNGFNVRDGQIRAVNNGSNQVSLEFYVSNADTPTKALTIDNTNTITAVGSISAAGITSNNINTTHGHTVSGTLTTSTTTADQVILTLSASTYRTVEYIIQATSGTSYHSTKFIIVHDGTNVIFTEYGSIYTTATLATYDFDISGGNIRLLTTPVNSVTVYKVLATAINI